LPSFETRAKSAHLRMRATHRCRGHGFRACAKRRIPEWRRLKFIVMPALVRASTSFFIAQGRRGWPGRSPAMTKIEASASCSALILRSGCLAASRRMAACTLVAILRDAREERAPQDEEKSDLHVQPPLQKYFRSLLTQITCLFPAVLSHRGAARDRHGRGAGCGGRKLRIDERAWLADGEVVWS
jgi:hypothetical protein